MPVIGDYTNGEKRQKFNTSQLNKKPNQQITRRTQRKIQDIFTQKFSHNRAAKGCGGTEALE
jgi:hypothetical protein